MVALMEHKFSAELSSLAVKFVRAYLECSNELQASVREMIEIIESPDSEPDERQMALHTVAEILFPELPAASATIEYLDECAREHQPDGAAAARELDAEEASFAQRLRAVMERRGLTQSELAARAGVGQPAISMMLGRQCRPQRRTILKLAEALGVEPQELWPPVAARA